MLWKFEGYLLVPHELLHVAAHRIIGRRCSYRLGGSYVSHLDKCTPREYFFCLLFPFFVMLPIAFLPLLLWITIFVWREYSTHDYLSVAPFWHQSLFILWFAMFTYVVSSCFYDLLFAVRLLLKKLSH
ncbi:MAG: hypothetical protein AAF702_16475 [Chloroflexota bacterium]